MKQKLMIDMDDVICDGGFLYLLNKFLDTAYTKDDFKNYYLQDIISKEKMKDWIEFFSKNNMYEKAEFIGDAFECIKKLNEIYDIYIVTAYIIKDDPSISGKVLMDKFNWLQENLPFIPQANYVFLNRKDFIDCDIKIDDKLTNLEGHGKIKLLFTAYHNKDISDETLKKQNVKRVNNWYDVEKELL